MKKTTDLEALIKALEEDDKDKLKNSFRCTAHTDYEKEVMHKIHTRNSIAKETSVASAPNYIAYILLGLSAAFTFIFFLNYIGTHWPNASLSFFSLQSSEFFQYLLWGTNLILIFFVIDRVISFLHFKHKLFTR